MKTLEHKYVVANFSATGVNTTGAITQLNNIPLGTTDSTRIGDKVKVTSINFRFNCIVGDTVNFIRIIFFQWHPGTNPGVSDVLLDPAQPITSAYSHDSRVSFRILFDRVVALSSAGPAAKTVIVNWRRALRKCCYLAGSATSGQENLWVSYWSDSNAVPNPTLEMYALVNYVDA